MKKLILALLVFTSYPAFSAEVPCERVAINSAVALSEINEQNPYGNAYKEIVAKSVKLISSEPVQATESYMKSTIEVTLTIKGKEDKERYSVIGNHWEKEPKACFVQSINAK